MPDARKFRLVHSNLEASRGNRFVLFVVLGVAAIVAFLVFIRNRTDDELIGVWRLVSTQTNGQPQRRERELWVFRHGSLTIVREGNTHYARISVNPAASPRHLDTDMLLQRTGIYEIVGDTLRVSQVVPDTPRPTEFKTSWGDMRTVSVLSRVAADPRVSTDELKELLLSEFGPATEYPERIEFDENADEYISNLMRTIYDNDFEMTAKDEVIYHVSWLITEVNNGGFHQFYYNSTGGSAVDTAAYLRKIGAPETATLVETGCRLFPDGSPPKDDQARRAQLEHFTLDQFETLRDLEERFYSRREDLNLLLKNYSERNP